MDMGKKNSKELQAGTKSQLQSQKVLQVPTPKGGPKEHFRCGMSNHKPPAVSGKHAVTTVVRWRHLKVRCPDKGSDEPTKEKENSGELRRKEAPQTDQCDSSSGIAYHGGSPTLDQHY